MATVVQITEGNSRPKRLVRALRGKGSLIQFPERPREPQACPEDQNAVRSDPERPKPRPDPVTALCILLGCVVLGGCRRVFHSARAAG